MSQTVTVPDYMPNCCLVLTFVVAAGQSVVSGKEVKLTSGADPSARTVQHAAANTDRGIGIVLGPLGANAITYTEGQKVQVEMHYSMIQRGIAGAAGVTAGNDIVATTAGALVDGPAKDFSGSTVVRSPGFALDTATSGKAFAFVVAPTTYPAA